MIYDIRFTRGRGEGRVAGGGNHVKRHTTHVTFFAFLCLLCASALNVHANLTNLVTEKCQGFGAVSAVAPDAFNYVQGTLNHVAVGPRTPGDTSAASLGWSGALYSTTNFIGAWPLTNGWTQAQSNGCLAAWFFFNPNPNPQQTRLMTVFDQNGPACGNFGTASNYLVAGGNPGDTTLQSIPPYTWLWLAMSWHRTGPFNTDFDFQFWCLTNGQSNPAMLYAWTNRNGPAGNMVLAWMGNTPEAGTARIDGRTGMASLYTYSTEYTDVAAGPSSFMIEPPETNNIAFYVNPATGNDTNSGVAPNQAWLSKSNINQWATSAGMLGSGSCATGPRLYLDTSGAPWDLSDTNTLTLNVAGLNVAAAPGNTWWTNTLDHVLTNSSFTQMSGGSPVWTTSDTQPSIVVWENGAWLAHPTNFLSFTAGCSNALAQMTSTGGFWTDGSTLYLVTVGGGNPATDGNRYTRSVNRGFGGANSAINLTLGPINFSDCQAGMTCMTSNTLGDSLGAYVVQALGTGGFNNTSNAVNHCRLFYGSKHILGCTFDATNCYFARTNVDAEQGSPYFSGIPFVDYMDGAPYTNNGSYYKNCACRSAVGQIGSAAGRTIQAQALYSHNGSGTGYQFNSIVVDGCDFENNTIGSGDAAAVLFITNTIFGGGQFGSLTNIVARSLCVDGVPSSGDGDEYVTVHDSVIVPTNQVKVSLTGPRQMAGTNTWYNVTILATPAAGGDDPSGGIFFRTAPVNASFSNCIFSVQGAVPCGVFENFSASDSLTLNHNFYALTNILARQYTNSLGATADYAFNNWQGLGFDANSASNNVPRVNPTTFGPLDDCPAMHIGGNLGVAQDFTGNIYANRGGAGAVQYRWGSFKGF